MTLTKEQLAKDGFVVQDFIPVYGLYRDYIKSEDGLINSRMTWMLTIHGFLYATYGLSLQKMLEINERVAQTLASHACEPNFLEVYAIKSPLSTSLIEIVIFLFSICIVGGVISFTAFASVSAAYDAATAVRLLFENYIKSEQHERRYVYTISKDLHIPLLTGGGFKNDTESRGFRAAWSIPLVLLLSWIVSAGYLAVACKNQYMTLSVNHVCKKP